MYILDQFSKLVCVPLETSDAKNIETIFCQGPGLIEAAYVDFPTDVYAIRRDAEDA